MNDTAEEVASLKELLHSMRNRVEIADKLVNGNRMDLCVTILEDIFTGAQYMVDKYCVQDSES